MELVEYRKKATDNREQIQSGNGGYDNFFSMERKLLNHLHRIEKVDAKKTIRILIDQVTIRSEDNPFKDIKYYFLTLSSLVTRHLEKNMLSASSAFSFNRTCNLLIDAKLTNLNAYEMADELIEFFAYVLADKFQPSYLHSTVNDVVYYIHEEIELPLTVENIAKKFNISTSHLSRIFRENTGITLIEYINIRKVEEAQYFLRFSNKSISEVSNQFNFCNQSYFTRIFKKYTGQTPKTFRSDLAVEFFRFYLPGEEKKQVNGHSLS